MSVSVAFTTPQPSGGANSAGSGIRRRIRTCLTGASVALLIVMLTAMPTLAGRGWCARDPIVVLGGVEYQVIVSVPDENVPQIDGELLFEIYSPKRTTQQLIFVDEGFNGYGEKIVFKEHSSRTTHMFYLDVPHNNDKFPVLMDIYRNGQLIKSVEGTSDVMWVSVPK